MKSRSLRMPRRPLWAGPLPGVLFSGLLAGVAGLACDRNIEPFEPGEVPRAPDLARIFPGAPAGGMRGGAADTVTTTITGKVLR